MADTPQSVLTPDQLTSVNRLSSALTFAAPLLILLGGLWIVVALVEVWKSSWAGLLSIPSGGLVAFAGLAFLAGATDAKYLHDVRGREKEHFTHTINSINVGYTALLILGCYVAFLRFINIWL